MSNVREIKKIFQSKPTLEGAGVRLRQEYSGRIAAGL
jgi:hypothetical protein